MKIINIYAVPICLIIHYRYHFQRNAQIDHNLPGFIRIQN